jgi:hypothetical protein
MAGKTLLWHAPALCGCSMRVAAEEWSQDAEVDGVTYRRPPRHANGRDNIKRLTIISVCDAHQQWTRTMPDTSPHFDYWLPVNDETRKLLATFGCKPEEGRLVLKCSHPWAARRMPSDIVWLDKPMPELSALQHFRADPLMDFDSERFVAMMKSIGYLKIQAPSRGYLPLHKIGKGTPAQRLFLFHTLHHGQIERLPCGCATYHHRDENAVFTHKRHPRHSHQCGSHLGDDVAMTQARRDAATISNFIDQTVFTAAPRSDMTPDEYVDYLFTSGVIRGPRVCKDCGRTYGGVYCRHCAKAPTISEERLAVYVDERRTAGGAP